VLPERERQNCLSQYREPSDGARDPVGWKQLRHIRRLRSWMVIRAGQPSHYEAQQEAMLEQARACSWRTASGCGAASDLPTASCQRSGLPRAKSLVLECAWRRVHDSRTAQVEREHFA
jgi:hypothetical protein